MTSKDPTHPRLEEIVAAASQAEFSREDDESTKRGIQFFRDLDSLSLQNHTSGDKADKTALTLGTSEDRPFIIDLHQATMSVEKPFQEHRLACLFRKRRPL